MSFTLSNIYRTRIAACRWLAGILLSFLWVLPSCKKTNHYAELVNDEPFLVTGELGLYNVGLGNYLGFETSYLVGDTCEMIGKFFLDRPGSRIQFGSDTPHILFKTQVPAGVNAYTHQQDHYDLIKFLVTKSMGLGDHIPVSIAANGVTLQAPNVSIRQFKGVLRRTDTTLYVDSLLNWFPPDLAYYKSNYLNMVNFASVSGDGTICFNNQTGVYIMRSGQVSTLLKTGSQLQENGSSFTIRGILASVISFGGDTATCSFEVMENNPDTATAYIFRLCKVSLASGMVTTLNRTKVLKGIGTVNEAPGPYEGSLSTLKIVATNLKTDVNGSLYFLNSYAPSTTNWDITARWYKQLNRFRGYIINSHVYSNICRADASGQVKSLFAQYSPYVGQPLYTIPGYHVAWTIDYMVGLDGSVGYAIDQLNTQGRNSLGYFDLRQDALLVSTGFHPAGYRFFSYDTSIMTGLHTPEYDPYFSANISTGALTAFQMLPDGDLLKAYTASLLAIDIQNKTDYCFAGTEVGLGSPPASQNRTAGPARNVIFSGSSLNFTGVDRQGTIYYYNIAPTSYAYTAGVTFCKLYSKK